MMWDPNVRPTNRRVSLQNRGFLIDPIKNGRNDEIWTHDLYHPKVAHYQAVLRPD